MIDDPKAASEGTMVSEAFFASLQPTSMDIEQSSLLSNGQLFTDDGAETTLSAAINAALREELARDPLVCLLGEDIGALGGIHGVTAGLQGAYGLWRVLDTPLTPVALLGAAVGMALMGLRPVVEIQSMDYLPLAYDQIAHMAAAAHWRSGGTMQVPLVIRGPAGGGTHGGPWRSASPEAWLTHIPGLRVVMPATPYDAKGMLKAAIRQNNPIVFLEPRYLYQRISESLPANDYTVPLDVAELRRSGSDLTILCYGALVYHALEAAELLSAEGIEAEVIDLRTLAPLDMATIRASVTRTRRAMIVHEDTQTGGLGAEIAARLGAETFDRLAAPILRVAAPDTPYPAAPTLEAAYLPNTNTMRDAARQLLRPR